MTLLREGYATAFGGGCQKIMQTAGRHEMRCVTMLVVWSTTAVLPYLPVLSFHVYSYSVHLYALFFPPHPCVVEDVVVL